ncbi:MAG: YcxB family protein [Acidobacteriota bacterium]|nr:YcxB family protein [Acidobacteriota bacterium]
MEKSYISLSVQLLYWETYRLVVVLTATLLRKFLYVWSIVVALMIATFILLLIRRATNQDYAAILENLAPLFFFGYGSTAIAILVVPLFTARRNLNDMRAHGATNYRFSEEGIHIETALIKSDLSWRAIARVKELRSAFFVFTSAKSGFALPKRCFGKSHDVIALRVFFRAYVAKSKLLAD